MGKVISTISALASALGLTAKRNAAGMVVFSNAAGPVFTADPNGLFEDDGSIGFVELEDDLPD